MTDGAMLDTQTLLRRRSQLALEAKKLIQGFTGKEHEMPAEVATQVQGYVGQIDGINAQIKHMDVINGVVQDDSKPVASPVDMSWRPAMPQEGDVPVDRKAWRNMDVDTMFGKKSVKYFVPLAVEKKGYTPAFESYLAHRYYDMVGPTDRKTLTEGADGSGGFLVPPDFHAEVIKKQMTLTQIRPNATVIQTSRDVVQWPRINYTTNPTDDPSSNRFTSGMRLTWTGETPASSTVSRVTEPVFGLYNIPVHVALASMPLANSLLEDTAADVMGLASDLFAEAYALGEEDAFINGGTGTTSVARPMGILGEVDGNGPASLTTAGAGAIVADDIIKLFYGVAVQYRNKGKWIMSSPLMQALELLKDSQNRYLISSLLQASLATPQFDTIKGKPVLISEFVPNTIATTVLDIIFGALDGYMIVDRVGLSVQKLTELYAETDVTLLLARKRVGGYCVRPWQIRVLKVQ